MQSARIDEADLLDERLDRLEADWNGTQDALPIAQLPAYLEGAEEGSRSIFLAHVINVDLEIRRTRKLNPSLRDYLQVFPEAKVLIENTFRTCAKPPPCVGRYRLDERLGKGGFGLVYRGWDLDLNRHVAVKLPHPDQLQGRQSVAFLLEEAQRAVALDHLGIVRILHVHSDEMTPLAVVMEYVDGPTLQEWMEQRGTGTHPDVREVARLVLAVANALAYAHEDDPGQGRRGLIHRDLKPANILLQKVANPPSATTEQGTNEGVTWLDENAYRPRLADFGLAVTEETQRKQRGVVAGSVAYMSPEQTRGEAHKLRSSSDIWSLGVIFYELLTGEKPFKGQSQKELIEEIQGREVRSPHELVPAIPLQLGEICLRCLRQQSQDRCSGRTLAEALGNWLRAESGPSVRVRPSPEPYRLFRVPAPSHGAPFVGRGDAVATLENTLSAGRPAIVVLHGFGGVGKSTILWHWLKGLEASDKKFRGLRQAFDWSFYNQGTTESSGVSSRQFLSDAAWHFQQFGCKYLEDAPPERLGELVAKAFLEVGGLMVLDGTEPLQYPPDIAGSRCRDQDLFNFLDVLDRNGRPGSGPPWLLVLSTRWPMPLKGDHVFPLSVIRLSPEDGAQLLRKFRLGGEEQHRLTFEPPAGVDRTQLGELEQAAFVGAAEGFGRQPLALVLLASYLIAHHGGQLALWKTVPVTGVVEQIPREKEHRHARRVMNAYLDLFRNRVQRDPDAARRQQAQASLQVLGLVSLFDRPAANELLTAVLAEPPIPGLTDGLTRTVFEDTVDYLKWLQLLTVNLMGELDTHPLIRERCGELLKEVSPNAWREAHCRLYTRLVPASSIPAACGHFDTLSRAVAHGCQAERFQDACDLYFGKFVEDSPGKDTSKLLISMADDLAVLAHFCCRPWHRLHDGVPQERVNGLLNEAGYDLFKLCRYSEAEKTFLSAIEGHDQSVAGSHNFLVLVPYVRNLNMLCKVRLNLGCMSEALANCTKLDNLVQSLGTPGEPDDAKRVRKLEMDNCFLRGEIHHQLGNWQDAEKAFLQGVTVENDIYDTYHDEDIFTARIIQYAYFQLERGELDPVLKRVSRAQEICQRNPAKRAIDIAYNRLILGQIHTQLGMRDPSSVADHFQKARTHLDDALRDCWNQGMLDGRIAVHLAFAQLFEAARDWPAWEEHLDRLRDLCEPADIRRLRTDYWLARSRYLLTVDKPDDALDHYQNAANAVLSMHYFRHKEAVHRLAEENGWRLPHGWPAK